jgi:hypothetical protein
VNRIRFKRIPSLLVLTVLCTGILIAQGTQITAPRNRYSPSDDVQLGREAANEVTRQMPLLPENGNIDAYVEHVGARLVDAIPPEFRHNEFRYEFSVVNARDINAFALPGGPMFVNRGMIEAANSEGEMAGVMAHEISHVALRHGTAQATKAANPGVQLGALGGAILGAVIGGNAGSVIAQGTQFGLGTYLLKFSREYETQADILGAQILARAGYDPMDLARMFETIERQGGSNGPEWLSSHPNPGNRYARISDEARRLRISPRNNSSAEFNEVRADLRRMPRAPTLAEIESSAKNTGGSGGSDRRYPDNARIQTTVEPPSTRYRNHVNDEFRVTVPSNWQEFSDRSSVTFAPQGAFGTSRGESVFTHGAIVGIADMNAANLRQASDQYIADLLNTNNYLRAQRGYQRATLDGRDALLRRLSGTSNITGRNEFVDVYTTLMDDGRLIYLIQVAPQNEYPQYNRAFTDMARSLRVFG